MCRASAGNSSSSSRTRKPGDLLHRCELFAGLLQLQGQLGGSAYQGVNPFSLRCEFRLDLRQGFAQHDVLVGHALDDLRSEVLRFGPCPELVHEPFVIAVDDVAPEPALGDQLCPRELSDGRAQGRPSQKAFCGGAYFLTFGFPGLGSSASCDPTAFHVRNFRT